MAKTKNVKLRAFLIENLSATEPHSGVLPLLHKVLKTKTKANDRRLQLNKEDADEDLLADYHPEPKTYMFGMMLRIIPADQGGIIAEGLFDNDKISIGELSVGESSASQYKSHYYVAVNNNYVVTNLPGNTNIVSFQTYLNWLLQEIRGNKFFNLIPVVKKPAGFKLKDIKGVEFSSGITTAAQISPQAEAVKTETRAISNKILECILGATDEFNDLVREDLVGAKIQLQFKRKPKDMDDAEYQRIMGAATKQLTHDEGFALIPKKGPKVTGADIKVTKDVVIELTESKRISEEQLKQEMEKFLAELPLIK